MSEEEAAVEEDETEASEESGEEEGKKKKSGFGLKKILMIAIPAILLVGGGGYFAMGFLGFGSESTEDEIAKPAIYYDLPDMVVNLSSTDRRAQFLKLKVSLEAKEQETLAALDPVMPRVMDMFQTYLRELRTSDLDGSAGIFKLKEELLRRVNIAIYPKQVDRVLFKEIIVQ
ncbi:MAG: flagellar basal body-associated FliL family protein [Rhizobiaceae bacterium]